MSKNSKRQARRSSTAAVSSSTTSARSASSTVSARSPEREFNPDYSPVIKDLRRIGILAGSFFTILIVLAMFLR